MVIAARPVGVCWIFDGHDHEPKIICIPVREPSYANVKDLDGVPPHLLDEIKQFFDCYKDLQNGHSSRFDRFEGAESARAVIKECRRC